MSRTRRAVRWLPALLPLLVGCLHIEMRWTIYPDRSGKVEMVMIPVEDEDSGDMSGGMGPGMTPGGGEDPFENAEGMIKGGPARMVQEAYFEDIQQVKMKGVSLLFEGGQGPSTVKLTVDLAEGGITPDAVGLDFGSEDASEVDVTDEGDNPNSEGDDETDDGSGEGEEEDPFEDLGRQMAEDMMKDMSLKIIVVMPGRVVETNGQKEDREAWIEFTGEQLSKAKEGESTHTLEVTASAPGEGLAYEWDAFKKALARAKQRAAEAAEEK